MLIDLCMEDASVLHLAAGSLGQVVVLSPILAEVDQLDETEVERLDLTLIEPELELVTAASVRRGGLSFRDRMCLLFSKTVGATLYTNDRALLNRAQSDGVDARWGLEILLELVALSQLSRSDAVALAKSICRRSRFPADTLITEFERRLQKL